MQNKSTFVLIGAIVLVAILLVSSGSVFISSYDLQTKTVSGGNRGEHPVRSRVHQEVTFDNIYVTQIGFWLRREATAEGTVYFEIRDMSDNVLVSNSMNVSEVVTQQQNWKGLWYDLEIQNSPLINGTVKVGIRFSNPSSGELGAAVAVGSVADNEYFWFNNNPVPSYDLYYRITYYQIPEEPTEPEPEPEQDQVQEPVQGGTEPIPEQPLPKQNMDYTLILIATGVIFLAFVLYHINRKKK